jgi:hypothetical protein
MPRGARRLNGGLAVSNWFESLGNLWGRGEQVLSAGEFLALLALSALAAFAVAALYSRFYAHRATGSDIHRSFPLLGVAITTIFICIQFSLPLSLGLLGALSIVRFRTPIKEPEEIGFLMVVIATSLACATGRLTYLGLVLVAAVAVLLAQELLRPVFRRRSESGLVVATFAEGDYEQRREALFAALAGAARRGGLESLSVLDQRVTVTWRFQGMRDREAPALERLLAEKARPESVSIVFASGAS